MPQPRRDSGLDDAQDALPASSSSRSSSKSRAARPATGAAARSPSRGAFRLGGPEILTILVAKPPRRTRVLLRAERSGRSAARHGLSNSVAVSVESISAGALSWVASRRELGFATFRGETHAAHPLLGRGSGLISAQNRRYASAGAAYLVRYGECNENSVPGCPHGQAALRPTACRRRSSAWTTRW
jgi:hypothetical protein